MKGINFLLSYYLGLDSGYMEKFDKVCCTLQVAINLDSS